MSTAIFATPTKEILIIFIILCRISGIFFFVPPFSDTNIRPIIKAVIAISIALMIPNENIRTYITNISHNYLALIFTIIVELAIGLTLGMIVKILTSTVQIAGLAIASQIGLSTGGIFDQSQQVQNSTLGLLLSLLTTVVILKSGLHIKIISGIVNSYDRILIGSFFEHYNDYTTLIISAVTKMWATGIQISLPFILINISMMLGAGILAKLMPQLQIFFLMLPLQIAVGIALFAITLSGIIFYVLDFLYNELSIIF